MEYRKLGETYYIRMDRGDEMVACVLEVCRREGVASATYSGIGGCRSAELQTFSPERGAFDTEVLEGMLELVSFAGNVISDDAGALYPHTHALFAFVQDGCHRVRGGHLKSATVLYAGEVELRPVSGAGIGYRFDPETGTGFWRFADE